MFVAAHPDDIDAMAGGLISQLTQQGTNVWYVIFTNGGKKTNTNKHRHKQTNKQTNITTNIKRKHSTKTREDCV